jgi:hypothetical protein
MWAKVLEWILNPATIGIVVIAVLFSAWQHTSHQNDLLKIQNKSLEQVVSAQKQTIEIQRSDFQLLGEFNKKAQTIVIKQQENTQKLHEIPNTTTNKPFANPELDRAAGLLRDYQQGSFPSSNSTDSNN